MKKSKRRKERPGPEPERVSLYPLNFDEAVDILVTAPPKDDSEKEEDIKVKGSTRKREDNHHESNGDSK
ncbi:MAG: hypothetical protein V1792_22335 [Pseudomonadota bacterium]